MQPVSITSVKDLPRAWRNLSGLDWLLTLAVLLGPVSRVFFIPDQMAWQVALGAIHIMLFCLIYAAFVVMEFGWTAVRSVFKGRVLLGLFCFWAVLAAISSSQAPLPGVSWFKQLQYMSYAVFAVAALTHLQRSPAVRYWLLLCIALSVIPYLGAMLFGIFRLTDQQFALLTWYIPGFINVRVLAFYLAIVIIALSACLSILPLPRGKIVMWGSIGLLSVVWTVLLWSGGRGAVLSFFAASVFFAWCLKSPQLWRLVRLNILIAVLAALLSATLPVPNDSFGVFRFLDRAVDAETVNAFSSGRITLWTQALEAWLQAPYFGWGSGQTKLLLPGAMGVFAQPHNFVIDALFSWGVFGGGAFIVFIGLCLVRAGKTTATAFTMPGAAGFVIAFMLALNALIDGSLFQIFPLFYFALALALSFSAMPQAPFEARS